MGYRTTNGNSNTVFRAVKESIRTDDAARHYGVKISKGGMAQAEWPAALFMMTETQA